MFFTPKKIWKSASKLASPSSSSLHTDPEEENDIVLETMEPISSSRVNTGDSSFKKSATFTNEKFEELDNKMTDDRPASVEKTAIGSF